MRQTDRETDRQTGRAGGAGGGGLGGGDGGRGWRGRGRREARTMRRWRPAGAPGRRPLAVAADESAVDETEAGGLRAGRARPTRPVSGRWTRRRDGRAEASPRGGRGRASEDHDGGEGARPVPMTR